MKLNSLVLAGALAALGAGGSAAADLAGSVWATEGGDSHVAFELDESAKLNGRFVWFRREDEEGVTLLDEENPDEALRTRTLRGVAFVSGFEPEGDGRSWANGSIYNPRNGRTYRSKLEQVSENALRVSGCVRVIFRDICQGQTWTRVSPAQ